MSLLSYVTSWYRETKEREPNWELTEEEISILGNPSQGTDPSLPPSLSCPPLLPLHTDIPYVLRFISSGLCIYTCVCLGLWTWVQGPQESKGVRFYGAGVTVSCDPLTWILGTGLQSTQQALWTTDPALSRFAFQWGIKRELVHPAVLAPTLRTQWPCECLLPTFLWGLLNLLHRQSPLLLLTEPLPGWRCCKIQSTWI